MKQRVKRRGREDLRKPSGWNVVFFPFSSPPVHHLLYTTTRLSFLSVFLVALCKNSPYETALLRAGIKIEHTSDTQEACSAKSCLSKLSSLNLQLVPQTNSQKKNPRMRPGNRRRPEQCLVNQLYTPTSLTPTRWKLRSGLGRSRVEEVSWIERVQLLRRWENHKRGTAMKTWRENRS